MTEPLPAVAVGPSATGANALHQWGQPHTTELAHAGARLVVCQVCGVRICEDCAPGYRNLDGCTGPLVTASRTDRQPPTSAAGAKGGSSAVAPGETKHPDLVTHHEPGARTPEVAEPRPASGCCRAEGISSEGGPASREHGASTSRQESA